MPHEFARAVEGGQPGSATYTSIFFANTRKPAVLGKIGRFHMKKGDVARPMTATGDDL